MMFFLTIAPGLKSKAPCSTTLPLVSKKFVTKAFGLSSARMLIFLRILCKDKPKRRQADDYTAIRLDWSTELPSTVKSRVLFLLRR